MYDTENCFGAYDELIKHIENDFMQMKRNNGDSKRKSDILLPAL